ncbi:MAG: UDP-N-acetylmuramoyl-L-alanyl-D-glutamate--2,6-diaminopimelate ligase [Candidatus Kapaibacteriota bacterium]
MKEVKQLISLLQPKEIIGTNLGFFSSVCYNSLKCEPYSLFVAISGTKFDGHEFIDQAIQRGAKYVVCERLPSELTPEITYILVDDSRVALAKASNFWFDFPTRNFEIVGVTGTNGKTTVTFLLKEIMRTAGRNCAVVGTIGAFAENYSRQLNNTTPESYELFRIFKDFKELGINFVAMEVSSHSLDQRRVYGIDFKGAIYTNLTQDHLDYHRDMDGYAQAKSLLFKSLNEDAIVVAFKDDHFFEKVVLQTKATRIYTIGRNNKSDITILNEKLGFGTTEFDLKFNNDDFDVDVIHLESNLLGRFNVENLALASVYAISTGIKPDFVKLAIANFPGVPGRMQKVFLKNGAIGIVDYAHTPDALRKALETCREILGINNDGGKLICVFGCGGERDAAKRPLMGKIASEFADYVILTNDNPRNENPVKIINQIYSGITNEGKKKVIQIGNRDEAIEYAYNLSRKNDIILVAGKGHEDYQIIGNVKFHFSDVEQLEKFKADTK